MRRCVQLSVVGSILLGLAYAALGDMASPARVPRLHGPPMHSVLPADDSAWHDGPIGMPAGTRYAVITGELEKASRFVIRVELPPGASIAPFRSSTPEDFIVLAGELELGSGATFDEHSMRAFGSGSFVALDADDPHYARTQKGATVQIDGVGPFVMDYL